MTFGINMACCSLALINFFPISQIFYLTTFSLSIWLSNVQWGSCPASLGQNPKSKQPGSKIFPWAWLVGFHRDKKCCGCECLSTAVRMLSFLLIFGLPLSTDHYRTAVDNIAQFVPYFSFHGVMFDESCFAYLPRWRDVASNGKLNNSKYFFGRVLASLRGGITQLS